MYQNDPTKCLTGKVRLSFCHLAQPRATVQGGEEKYSVTLLIPKTDISTRADVDAAIQVAAQQGLEKKWNGIRPPILKVPIYDGDGVRPTGVAFGDECKGHWVLTASSNQKPECVHISNVNVPLAPADVYSGMYARVTVRFFAYANSGNKGIGCGLGNVLKLEDGEPLSSHANAQSDFSDFATASPVYAPSYAPAVPQPVYAPPQYVAPPPAAYAQPQYATPVSPAYTQTQYPPQAAGIDPITGRPLTGPVMGL